MGDAICGGLWQGGTFLRTADGILVLTEGGSGFSSVRDFKWLNFGLRGCWELPSLRAMKEIVWPALLTVNGSRLTAHGSRLTAHGSRLTCR